MYARGHYFNTIFYAGSQRNSVSAQQSNAYDSSTINRQLPTSAGVANGGGGVQHIWGSQQVDDGSQSLQTRMAPAEPAAGPARMMQASSGGGTVDAGMSNSQPPRYH